MKVLFAGIIVVVIGCVYMIRQGGYNPKPILVMKPSPYNTFKDLGDFLYKRFYTEAKNINHIVVFCDFSNCDQQQIWQSFNNQIIINGLKPRITFMFNSFVGNQSEMNLNKVFNVLKTNQYSMIVLPIALKGRFNNYSKSTIEFTMTNFFLKKESEDKSQACPERDNLENLNCLRLGFSRRFYRKKIKPISRVAGMEKTSNNKYILYLN